MNNEEVGTGYCFRRYHYCTVQVKLAADKEAVDVCLDTGCHISLVDREFLLQQIPELKLKKMASPIFVKGIGSNRHVTDEFAVLMLHFPGKHAGVAATGIVKQEVHVVNGLKAKVLISTDILTPEGIDTMPLLRKAVLGSCDNLELEMNVQPLGLRVKCVVHSKGSIMIPANSQVAVPVHHTTLPNNRDFIFEPGESPVSLFASVTDHSFNAVLARNESNRPVHIARNQRLRLQQLSPCLGTTGRPCS